MNQMFVQITFVKCTSVERVICKNRKCALPVITNPPMAPCQFMNLGTHDIQIYKYTYIYTYIYDIYIHWWLVYLLKFIWTNIWFIFLIKI